MSVEGNDLLESISARIFAHLKPAIVAEIDLAVAKRLESDSAGDDWPEFISLRLFCDRCGLSYSSMRRSERRHELPNGGCRDVTISGRQYWTKDTILRFLEDKS